MWARGRELGLIFCRRNGAKYEGTRVRRCIIFCRRNKSTYLGELSVPKCQRDRELYPIKMRILLPNVTKLSSIFLSGIKFNKAAYISLIVDNNLLTR